jgi:tripartite-type tricarboxylate transporter receptor subunit TctC
MCDQTTNTTGQIRGGKVKVFGVTTRTRVASLKDIPTLQEQGLKGAEVAIWHGLYAPKNTPKPVIDRLNSLARALAADPAERKRLEDNFLVPMSRSPEEFAALVKADAETWARTVGELGIQLN